MNHDCCQYAEDYNQCIRKMLHNDGWVKESICSYPEKGAVLVFMLDGRPIYWKYAVKEIEENVD